MTLFKRTKCGFQNHYHLGSVHVFHLLDSSKDKIHRWYFHLLMKFLHRWLSLLSMNFFPKSWESLKTGRTIALRQINSHLEIGWNFYPCMNKYHQQMALSSIDEICWRMTLWFMDFISLYMDNTQKIFSSMDKISYPQMTLSWILIFHIFGLKQYASYFHMKAYWS